MSNTNVAPTTSSTDVVVAKLRKQLVDEFGEIELNVLTNFSLADAIREGASVSTQAVGSFGSGETACALSAAYLAAKARGYIS